MEQFALGKKGKTALYLSGGVTAVIALVMNLLLIPKIEASTGGIRCFDMNFGYSVETAREFLSRLSEEGRALYLHAQLPLDFIYPLAYCLFFSLLMLRLTEKKGMLAFPVLLAVFDYTENVCSIIMLKSAVLSERLARVGSAATSVKTLLMYAVFAVIIIDIIHYFIKKKKAEKTS